MKRQWSTVLGWKWCAVPLLGWAVSLCGCGDGFELMDVNFQNPAPAQQPNQQPPQKELNRPLLRELRKYAEQANDFGDLGADQNDVLKQLDAADKVLTRIHEENRIALANANRRAPSLPAGRTPNLVMIVAPRLGVSDLGSYGQTKIPTPNLDRLAAEGVLLTDFYAGGPTAASSQWALQTGWTTSRSHDDLRIKENTTTLAGMLWRGGYHTAFFGMWYGPDNAAKADVPSAHGYDEWVGQLHAKDAQTAFPKMMWVNDQHVQIPEEKGKEPLSAGDLIVRAAIKELEEQAQSLRGPRPLFMMVVLPPYLDMAADFADKELSKDTDWPAAAQSYGAAVRMTDRDVGLIHAAIDRLGLASTTSVYFTALTGADVVHAKALEYFRSTGHFRTHDSKLGEGNLRVPFIAAFPPVFRAGLRDSHPAALWDVFPTFAELTLTQVYRRQLDGVSFAWTLKTGREIPPHLLYWETAGAKAQAVRLGPWKGLRPAGSDTLFLYNLPADPGETNDVAKEHPETVEKLIVPPQRPR